MTYEELVTKCKDAYATADASAIAEHVAVQFNIRGEGEGALYLEIADGKVNVQPFEYYDRNAIITTNAQALVDIATGNLTITEAYNKGTLYVDGDLGKASLLEKIVLKKEEEKAPAKKAPAKKAPAKKVCAKKAPAKKAEAPKAEAPKAEAPKATEAKKTTK